jgi:hypothetical protein
MTLQFFLPVQNSRGSFISDHWKLAKRYLTGRFSLDLVRVCARPRTGRGAAAAAARVDVTRAAHDDV